MLKPKHSIFLILPLAAINATHAQAAPIPVQSFTKDANGVTVRMNPGLLKLQVCDARTVRVLYMPADQLPPKSFVITRDWKPVAFKTAQDAKSLTVSTANLRVVVNKATGAVTFLDAAGKTLLAEAADGGKNAHANPSWHRTDPHRSADFPKPDR